MKTPFFLLTLVFLSSFNSTAQEEFSFQLYFEDAAGNRDTLTLGYDDNATNGLDATFGETNIIVQPWDSVFEVRITDEFERRSPLGSTLTGTYHLKKQIVKDECNSAIYWWNDILSIDIKCSNFPILVSWDSTQFNPNCLKGTVYTSSVPGGWFDTGGFKVNVSELGSYQINKNYDSIPSQNEMNSYYDDTNIPIHTTWFAFADSTVLTVAIDDISIHSISIAPNPFANSFTIDSDTPFSAINLVDAMGKNIRFERNAHSITPINCSSGIYFLSVLFENGQSSKYKLIKQ
jgi:hypothetical protein